MAFIVQLIFWYCQICDKLSHNADLFTKTSHANCAFLDFKFGQSNT